MLKGQSMPITNKARDVAGTKFFPNLNVDKKIHVYTGVELRIAIIEVSKLFVSIGNILILDPQTLRCVTLNRISDVSMKHIESGPVYWPDNVKDLEDLVSVHIVCPKGRTKAPMRPQRHEVANATIS